MLFSFRPFTNLWDKPKSSLDSEVASRSLLTYLLLPCLCALMDVLAAGSAGANGMHTEQMWQTLSCRWGSGSRKDEAELWTRLHLHYGIIDRNFSSYNLSDLAAYEFETRVSDFFRNYGSTWAGPSFLGLPSAPTTYSWHWTNVSLSLWNYSPWRNKTWLLDKWGFMRSAFCLGGTLAC